MTRSNDALTGSDELIFDDVTGVVTLPRQRVRAVIIALLLGTLLSGLDQMAVSTALPTIVGDLGGAAHLTWLVTAYLLASTVSTPLWGKLGDLYGRKVFFQLALALFLLGSVLSGICGTMLELILARGVQGLGGGGLIVCAQAIIGDVIVPRERGKYQSLFSVVFAVTSLVGPLAGGLVTQAVGWRWVFLMNLPIGIAAMVVAAVALPAQLPRTRRVIDYYGAVLLAAAATCLMLCAGLGGPDYPWLSAPIIGLGLAGVLLGALWVILERRAVDPVLPPALFANRVFAAGAAVSVMTGFVLFGVTVFLPVFLQVVRGVSPVMSGVGVLPLMVGLVATSLGSGVVISRTGRYRAFPVCGTAAMAVGLGLLSLVGPATPAVWVDVSLALLGGGIGCVLQVLVVAVQAAVRHDQLGAATGGVTFFRSIGGAFGTAVFGAIFANLLAVRLTALPGGLTLTDGSAAEISPARLRAMSEPMREAVIAIYTSSVQTVFLAAAGVAALAFVLTLFLPEVKFQESRA
ncbi:MAG TPA: MFS transporter [Pseudonocardia sp.]|jgi:EmrB/QacA subfamily drug resistance transporter|nr:MFS transporter [Pseudonocardia sp.]